MSAPPPTAPTTTQKDACLDTCVMETYCCFCCELKCGTLTILILSFLGSIATIATSSQGSTVGIGGFSIFVSVVNFLISVYGIWACWNEYTKHVRITALIKFGCMSLYYLILFVINFVVAVGIMLGNKNGFVQNCVSQAQAQQAQNNQTTTNTDFQSQCNLIYNASVVSVVIAFVIALLINFYLCMVVWSFYRQLGRREGDNGVELQSQDNLNKPPVYAEPANEKAARMCYNCYLPMMLRFSLTKQYSFKFPSLKYSFSSLRNNHFHGSGLKDASGKTVQLPEQKEALEWSKNFTKTSIPKHAFDIKFSRSSGPGGQNVNKVESKVELRFSLDHASWLPEYVKDKLIENGGKHICKNTGLYKISSQKYRTQQENLDDCIDRLMENIHLVINGIPSETDNETHERVERIIKAEATKKKENKKLHSMAKKERKMPKDY